MLHHIRVTLRSAALALLSLVPPLSGAQTSAGTNLPPKSLLVTGSSTVYPLMTDIVRRFEGLNPRVSIDVRSGGSAKGIADLRGGESHITIVSPQFTCNRREQVACPVCPAC